MRLAYLVNQYPKVSHTFIRREIAAVERGGATVLRYALRGWNAVVPDPEDSRERDRTRYLLRGGSGPLLAAMVAVACRRPWRFVGALRQAWRASRHDRRPLRHLAYLAEACLLLRDLRGRAVERVHAHFGTNGAEVAMLCRLLGGPPYSFTVHGPEEFDRGPTLGLADKVAHADAVVAISSFGRSQLWRWCRPQDRAKVHVAHCGLEPSFFEQPVTPVPLLPRIVCVGRLHEQKGHLVLLDAISKLAAEGSDVELVLVGDGELRDEVEGAVRTRGLESRVRITGWVANAQVLDELRAARALVLASVAEGLPVVLMEAMALGRPVLGTYVAGIPELVRGGVDGWLFPAGSADAAADAIRACLRAPAATLQAMADAGRERVRARHDADHEAARLLSIWRGARTAAHGRVAVRTAPVAGALRWRGDGCS